MKFKYYFSIKFFKFSILNILIFIIFFNLFVVSLDGSLKLI